ncbi:putative glucose-1-phosphate adenylyltransferase large subunit, chloroplastic isoform B [Glycine soja]|nr:hypothetical protein JHK87_000892 [Glycine soja]RZC28996.1 putative glucose-1-phosphate adenylyltransferase large subunit, chloroplastic isoform A [Glycine soja]RZC28997.1 putative glucose-1-phosphate adenylyltransferase large subunit, chloroplastic isoform B [Glycine soja]
MKDAKHANIENVLILAGDNLYRMDCMDLVQSHVEKNTDITVSCAAVGERLHDMLGGCMLEAFLLQLMSSQLQLSLVKLWLSLGEPLLAQIHNKLQGIMLQPALYL